MNRFSNVKIVFALKSFFFALAAGLIIWFVGFSSLAQEKTVQQPAQSSPQTTPKKLDPAAWGANHVGKPIPEFTHGDECLFCHRNTIGATWQNNAHGIAIRHREDAPDLRELQKSNPKLNAMGDQIEYFLGSRHRVRFLKKDGYGKFATLEAQAILGADKKAESWVAAENPAWDKDKFANRCAGCHTTAVDSKNKTFAEFGLDCYVCHGVVDVNHGNDTALALLSKKNRSNAKVITSICAQCHLRESKSKTSGLPYANGFVAGDNLFQDLAVDWTKADDANLNAGDRHVWRNARDVAVNGDESITCLSCHQVHTASGTNPTIRHRRILRAPICGECHAADNFKNPIKYTVKSSLCEY
ncbi:MAG: multiheme c-type cytochrome [Blastocatellia bacterium]